MKKLILSIAVILLIVSCGARKVSTEIKHEEVKTDSVVSEKEQVVTEEKKDVVDSSYSEEIEICAEDTSKPIIINNVKFFNAKIHYKKKKNNIVDKSVKKVSETKEKEVSVKKEIDKKSKVKQSERKKANLYWLLILIPIYLLYKYRWDIIFGLKERFKL